MIWTKITLTLLVRVAIVGQEADGTHNQMLLGQQGHNYAISISTDEAILDTENHWFQATVDMECQFVKSVMGSDGGYICNAFTVKTHKKVYKDIYGGKDETGK